MIKEIERLVLNKYSNLTKEKQSEYFIKEVKKLIEDNKIDKKELLKKMEDRNEKF